MSLTDDEKEQFRKLGYLIKPGFLDASRVAAVAAEIDRYMEIEPRFDGRNV